MSTQYISEALRLDKIPKYLFAEIDDLKIRYQSRTSNIIDFGEGNPTFVPNKRIIQTFVKSLNNCENHRYPSYQGKLSTRIAVAEWYKKRFNVVLNPETEVAMLIGSKEGIAHLIWALVDKDDIVYVPSPSYPVYLNEILLAGGKPKILPLLERNNFLPEISEIRPNKKLKLLCLNYPNNPTSATAPYSFYKKIIDTANRYGFFCFNDNVYSELYYSEPPHSILEVPGAKHCCVEFHSFSKTFSMCGWRIGFVVGNSNIIKALLKIKQNVDSGPFGAIQDAATYALNNTDLLTSYARNEYKKRLTILTAGLNKLGWNCRMPKATFYLWIRIPISQYKNNSLEFTKFLLKKTGILVAPGVGFGKYGEGYLRFAVIQSINQVNNALRRLSEVL